MTTKRFSISSKIVYTVVSPFPDIANFQCESIKELEEIASNMLGGFVDQMHDNQTHNVIKQRIQDHDFIMQHRKHLEALFDFLDNIEALKNPAIEHDCSDYYCNRCGSGSEIEYTGE